MLKTGKIKYPIKEGLKQCGDCKEWKLISEYNKARNHYTSRCRDCLRIYAKSYRDKPEIQIESKQYHKEYMANAENRAKKNAYQRKRNKTDKVREQRNQQRRDWALREKQKAVNYKGGKCQICGYDKCLAAMDFHHKNALGKNGYGTGALKQHWTFEKNKVEIDKCILVCVRCHRELHAGVIML